MDDDSAEDALRIVNQLVGGHEEAQPNQPQGQNKRQRNDVPVSSQAVDSRAKSAILREHLTTQEDIYLEHVLQTIPAIIQERTALIGKVLRLEGKAKLFDQHLANGTVPKSLEIQLPLLEDHAGKDLCLAKRNADLRASFNRESVLILRDANNLNIAKYKALLEDYEPVFEAKATISLSAIQPSSPLNARSHRTILTFACHKFNQAIALEDARLDVELAKKRRAAEDAAHAKNISNQDVQDLLSGKKDATLAALINKGIDAKLSDFTKMIRKEFAQLATNHLNSSGGPLPPNGASNPTNAKRSSKKKKKQQQNAANATTTSKNALGQPPSYPASPTSVDKDGKGKEKGKGKGGKSKGNGKGGNPRPGH